MIETLTNDNFEEIQFAIISAVSKKHHQKAHIRLTGNAKEFIEKELGKLEKIYGIENFYSK